MEFGFKSANAGKQFRFAAGHTRTRIRKALKIVKRIRHTATAKADWKRWDFS